MVRRVLFAFVTCTVVLMRMPMNLDERRRMRPKMRPPGPRGLTETLARSGVAPRHDCPATRGLGMVRQ
jgi:hypothetical protein